MKPWLTFILYCLILSAAVYLNFAMMRYRFAYPEKTETQLFLDMPHWITWPHLP